LALLTLVFMTSRETSVFGQSTLQYQVSEPSQVLEMVVKTSRILTVDEEVPRVMVQNQDVVRVTPLSPTQVQVTALQPGVTQINLFDKANNARTVDIVVTADAQQLQMVLQTVFPKAAIKVRPLRQGILLEGYVDRPEMVERIVEVSKDYYPKIINNIRVGGAQQVALYVKVMEVSRSKLRSSGFDWGALSGDGDFVIQSAAGLVSAAASNGTSVVGTGADTIRFGVVDGTDGFFGFLNLLKTHNVAKILAEPVLVSVSGRPAYFHEGGEFPIITPSGLTNQSVEFKQFGTRVDFVPIVQGNGNIRLEVRPQISERDDAGGVQLNGFTIPSLRVRQVETAVEMRAGQTLALAGLIQTRTTGESRGIPWLREIPWAGNAFGRVASETEEVELLIVVRPELVAPLDPEQVPAMGPGQFTTAPTDVDLYGRGYVEVPKCCPDVSCDPNNPACGMPAAPGMGYGGPMVPGSYEGSTYPAGPVQNEAGELVAPTDSMGATMGHGMPLRPGMAPGSNYHVSTAQAARATGTPTMGTPTSQPVYRGNNGTQSQLLGPSGYDELNY
jgi:pilus assembly protein CpaC